MFLEVNESTKTVKKKFISPPVSACIKCKGSLTMHNLPSRAVLFSLDGPIHVSKVTLGAVAARFVLGHATTATNKAPTFIQLTPVTKLY